MEGRLAIYTATRIGNPVSELLAISRSKDVYAIVISSHGAGSVERLLVGSTTNSLARDAECPVLVVPADINFSKPEKIGLASDFREVVKHTPQKTIIALLDAFGAKLEILHADPDFHEFEPATMEEGLMLDTMFEDHRPSFRFLHSGYTEESILTYAAEHYIDMLVVVPKEHGFAERLFRHQHTETFLKEATLPILVLKGKLD
jgi:nucleotide-binding universal stress UspA family protein